jgi:hypothetical protein
MPAPITSPFLSIPRVNDQSGTLVASLSEDNKATRVIFQVPKTTIEICGVPYILRDEETAANKKVSRVTA